MLPVKLFEKKRRVAMWSLCRRLWRFRFPTARSDATLVDGCSAFLPVKLEYPRSSNVTLLVRSQPDGLRF